MTRYYLDTSAHIERWSGEPALRKGIAELLVDEAHATSSHALREWKGIVEGGAADILNLLEESSDGMDIEALLARLSQGMHRDASKALRVLSMLSAGGVIDANIETRARYMIRTGARKLFEFPGATYNFDQNFADYDVAADGRFLAIEADTTAPDEIHVVLNWTEELRRSLGR